MSKLQNGGDIHVIATELERINGSLQELVEKWNLLSKGIQEANSTWAILCKALDEPIPETEEEE